jgi:glyoxylase-like metal-dependent hydrolase (beta-lactamase superfamily II)
MKKPLLRFAATWLAACSLMLSLTALAQAPEHETTKISDNVYVYRHGGHQAMFVVTPAGVIATDPIGYQHPETVTTYIAEIRKITQAPIKYVIYSHHHYDHIAGGKPFKDLGATFIAHKNAKARLLKLKYPDVVIPDVTVGNKHSLNLGGVRVDLVYVGRNHSDSSLVMLVPKDKIAFTVDFVSPESVMFRGMPDSYISEWFTSLDRVLALDWDKMIGGHPYPGGRLATKDDVRSQIEFMNDLSAAVKQAADNGKCWDPAPKEVKLPKYEKWANYEHYLPGNVERFCGYWGRGIDG